MRNWTTAAMLMALAMQLSAQTPVQPSGEGLRFEVASIKRNTSGRFGMDGPSFKGTTYTAVNAPVQALISDAYGVAGRDVDAPKWIFSQLLGGGSERYDVIAKAADGSSVENQRAMLRTLLAERFALRLHREKRELPVYILTKLNEGRSLGPNLRAASKDCLPSTACEGRIGGGRAAYKGAQWSNVLQAVAAGLDGARLVDRTGLSGAFDFELNYTPQGQPTTADSGGDLLTAVRQQLGLKLESGRAPFEVIVVDSIERPTPD
jgi:uncharacterized protein (TIGR03435 family)